MPALCGRPVLTMPDDGPRDEPAASDENPGWAGCAMFAAIFFGSVLALLAAVIALVHWNLRDF